MLRTMRVDKRGFDTIGRRRFQRGSLHDSTMKVTLAKLLTVTTATAATTDSNSAVDIYTTTHEIR